MWDGVQEILGESGIQIVSGMYSTRGEDYTTPDTIRRTGGVILDEYWDENVELAKGAAASAQSLGVTEITVHAGFLPHETRDPMFDKLSGRVAQLASVFADAGATLTMETGQETADTLLMFLEEMKGRGVTNLAVNFDPANMLLYDMDEPIDALRKLVPHVKHVHVKDANRPATKGEWGEEVVVGTGSVDWIAFVRTLAEADFAGGYNFEREAGDDRVGDIRKGIVVLTEVIGQI